MRRIGVRIQRRSAIADHDRAPQTERLAPTLDIPHHTPDAIAAAQDFSLDQIDTTPESAEAAQEAARLADVAALLPGVLARGADAGSPPPADPPANPLVLQPALRVNAPDDAYEAEADRVAATVMRRPADGPPEPPTLSPLSVQRSSDAGVEVTPAIEAGVARLQGGGAPLPASEQSFFSQRMGLDFGDVRIHQAPDLARSLDARAFTVGSDIAFDAGEYQPGTEAGRALLAHELTHVVQQTGGIAAKRIQRAPSEEDADVEDEEAAEPLDQSLSTAGEAQQETTGKQKRTRRKNLEESMAEEQTIGGHNFTQQEIMTIVYETISSYIEDNESMEAADNLTTRSAQHNKGGDMLFNYGLADRYDMSEDRPQISSGTIAQKGGVTKIRTNEHELHEKQGASDKGGTFFELLHSPSKRGKSYESMLGSISEIKQANKDISDAHIAQYVRSIIGRGTASGNDNLSPELQAHLKDNPGDSATLTELAVLMGKVEIERGPEAAIASGMTLDMIEKGMNFNDQPMSWDQMMEAHPFFPKGAAARAETLRKDEAFEEVNEKVPPRPGERQAEVPTTEPAAMLDQWANLVTQYVQGSIGTQVFKKKENGEKKIRKLAYNTIVNLYKKPHPYLDDRE